MLSEIALMASLLMHTPDTLRMAVVTDSRNIATRSSAPLQRMDRGQFTQQGTVTISEALRNFAGVSIKDYGGIGGLKTVSIRGFGTQHTGVCLDGTVISDAQNGQVDIGRFDLEALQNISMEIGGSDDIFRSARVHSYAGVLSLESIRPTFGEGSSTHASVQMRYGSFQTFNPYVRLEQKLSERWSLTWYANYLNSNGNYPFVLRNGDLATNETRLNSAVQTLNSELNIFGEDLSFKISWHGSTRGLPGSVVLYYQNPTEHLWTSNFMVSALYNHKFTQSWRLKASISYTNAWDRYTNNDIIYPQALDDVYSQHELTASAVALWEPLSGLEVSLAEDLVISHLDSNLSSCVFPTRFSSFSALSAKYVIQRFKVSGGLLLSSTVDWTNSASGSSRTHLSPWLSASCRILKSSDLRIRASLKEGYRMPTFNDLYYPRVGSRNLAPEKAWQSNIGLAWEHRFGTVGVRGRLSGPRVSLTADAYYNMVRDKIVATPTMFIWTMRNVDRVQMAGCDITASLEQAFTPWLALRADGKYSYQWAVDITDRQAANYMHQIPYTPRHCGSTALTLLTPWLNLSYSLNAAAERYSLAQNLPQYRIAPYADHGISLNGDVHFGRRHRWCLHWSAEALNLAGENYEIIQYYPMPGRNYRITIKITY